MAACLLPAAGLSALEPVSAVWRGSRSSERILSEMSWARGSLGLLSIDWSAVTMQAVSRIEDKNRTSVPVKAERRRQSGWTTFNKIRLPTLTVESKNQARPRVQGTLEN